MTSVSHVAGIEVQVGNFLRQRCGWCGEIIIDVDLSRIAVAIDPDDPDKEPTYPVWPVGDLIRVDGGLTCVLDIGDGPLPDDACARSAGIAEQIADALAEGGTDGEQPHRVD